MKLEELELGKEYTKEQIDSLDALIRATDHKARFIFGFTAGNDNFITIGDYTFLRLKGEKIFTLTRDPHSTLDARDKGVNIVINGKGIRKSSDYYTRRPHRTEVVANRVEHNGGSEAANASDKKRWGEINKAHANRNK